ncbi:Glycosyltransferase involved in cell wall bisynthesis [Chitinophaga sp. YR573]|uniref:glycosyltransferase n=1 Tax=Chitinophaga sp. YR573 TaxID=1881040 RepID=UPI0008D81A84|nr:glycosyltransferase [Chitinophaga sp. YR573]SEW44512.1 Glycosyltransferase involved in cell wall bisynthesis [Chitinophaga sp. YR573]
MKLFINVSNLRFGGGKTVGMNIINYYMLHPDISSLVIAAPAGNGYERFDGISEKVKIVYFHKIFNTSVFKLIITYILLPVYQVAFKADFILSLGNVAIPTRKPQLLLIMMPYLAYPESIMWERIKKNNRKFYFYIRNVLRLIKANLKYASILCVQTEVMKKRISALYNIPLDKVFVMPCAVSFTSSKLPESAVKAGSSNSKEIKLLFLSKYYLHKNFEILYEVGREILNRKLDIKISVTIEPEENEGSREFLENIAKLNLGAVIVNKGNITLEQIPYVYDEHDGVFLPTFLESFSGTYIESMYFGKPIFTSNLDFAEVVCKDAAYYFDPVDANDIIDTIVEAFDDPVELTRKVDRGNQMIAESPSWNDIGKFIDEKILKLS